jgi:hypothetical protein
MRAADVLTYLEAQRVTLTLTEGGALSYRAPRGVMTMVLKGVVKTYREPLTHLLSTGEDAPLPGGVTLPETDYRRFLTWSTGKPPANAQMLHEPLPPAVHHDLPSVPETVLGPPCPRKGCDPNALSKQGKPLSTYYRRTRLCVRCYCRLRNQLPHDQTTTTGEEEELRLW